MEKPEGENKYDIPFPNTRYAKRLDILQHYDYGTESTPGLLEQENKIFADNCKKLKVPLTRLKKYEKTLEKLRSGAERLLIEKRKLIAKAGNKRTKAKLEKEIKAILVSLEIHEKELFNMFFSKKKQ